MWPRDCISRRRLDRPTDKLTRVTIKHIVPSSSSSSSSLCSNNALVEIIFGTINHRVVFSKPTWKTVIGTRRGHCCGFTCGFYSYKWSSRCDYDFLLPLSLCRQTVFKSFSAVSASGVHAGTL